MSSKRYLNFFASKLATVSGRQCEAKMTSLYIRELRRQSFTTFLVVL